MDIPATAGTIVYTDKQTAGRGTHNRSWVSLPGNLLCTINYAKPNNLSNKVFCLLVGVKIIEAINHPQIKLKWPNDLIINGKKCGGVLITSSNDLIKIGIGINLITSPDTLELKKITSSLSDIGLKIDAKALMISIAEKITQNNYSEEQIINHWSRHADWNLNKYGQPIKLTKFGNLIVQDVKTQQIKIIKNIF